MVSILFPNEYFSPKATLESGQTFRFCPVEEGGYFVLSADKACLLFPDEKNIRLECENADEEYFRNYFDFQTDYAALISEAESFSSPFSPPPRGSERDCESCGRTRPNVY